MLDGRVPGLLQRRVPQLLRERQGEMGARDHAPLSGKQNINIDYYFYYRKKRVLKKKHLKKY